MKSIPLHWWEYLTKPSPDLKDPAARFQVRMLLSLLLLLLVGLGFTDFFLPGCLSLVAAYGLVRSGADYRLGALIMIATLSIILIVNASNQPTFLYALVVPIALGFLFLPRQIAALFSGLNLIMLAGSPDASLSAFLLVLASSGVCWLSAWQCPTPGLSSEYAHGIMDHLGDIIVLIDNRGVMEYVSHSVTNFLGYLPDRFVGVSVLQALDVIHPDDRPGLHTALERFIHARDPFRYEFRVRHEQGQYVWFDDVGKLILDQNGSVQGGVFVIRDITHRKQAEQAIREREERWRSLTEYSSDYVVNVDRNLNIQFVNRASPGLKTEDLIGTALYSYVDEANRARVKGILEEVLTTGNQISYETVLHTPGQDIYYESVANPQFDQGHITGITVTSRDITQRRHSEEALRMSEERLRLVTDNVQDMIIQTDEKGVIRYVSPSAVDVWEIPPQEIVGTHLLFWLERIHPEDRQSINDIVTRRITTGIGPSRWSYRFQHPSGELRWKEHAVKPYHNVDGSLAGFTYTIRDITERKQIEMALRESQTRFRSYFDLGLIGIAITSPDRRWLEMNDKVCEILGYSREELMQMTWAEVTHPDDLPTNEALVNQLLAGEINRFSLEKRYIRKDLQTIYVAINVGCVRKSDGSVNYSVTIIEDITERRLATIARQQSEARLKQAMNVANLGIWDWDIATDLTIWTGEMFRMYGISPEAFTGKGSDYLNFTHPDDRDQQRGNIHKAFAGGITEQELVAASSAIPHEPQEFRILRPDGTICYVRGDAVAIVDEQGNPLRMVGVLQDITALKLAEEAKFEQERLLNLLKTEQDWNAAIQRVIKVFSHELRTPLSIIQTANELMTHYADQLSPERRLERLETITSQVQRMSQTLDDVVHIVRDAFHHKVFHPTMIDLEQICQVTIDKLQETIGSKHRLIFVTDGQIKKVFADEKLITRILINLLSNAIKYSPEGSEIRLELRDDNGIALQVSDQGMGISPEDQARIFEPFFRTDNVGSIHGTGLGLSIVHDCVELHNGVISVQSQPGVGSHFNVWLPLEATTS